MSRSLRLLRNSLIGLVLLVALSAGFVVWLLQRPSGGAWLLAHLPGVQVEAPEGSLMGDFRARRLVLTWAGGTAELRGLRWSGLGVTASQGLLLARELAIDEVMIRTTPSNTPTALPDDLTLPLGVHIGQLIIGRLSWAADQPPLQTLVAEIDLPRRGTHHIKLTGARWQQLLLTGDARVDSAAPMQAEATLTVQPQDAGSLPWRAVAAARGPLARLQAKAEVEAAHQTLKAAGEVQPFSAWPVNTLQLQADRFDLSALAALAPGLPRTSLSGSATLKAPARDAEATLQAELRNTAAGRWDQGALPVQRLALALAGRPDLPTSLRLTTLDAELAGGGRVQGQGRHEADGRWQLDARVQGLRPEALDARATPARLDGPLTLTGGAQEPLSAQLDLRGSLQQRPLRLRAQLKGRLLEHGSRWQIEEARLASGDAEIRASGQVEALRPPQDALQLAAKVDAQVRRFDPHLLWRGEPGSAWARLPGATQLNADARLDVRGSRLDDATGTLEARLLPGSFGGLPLEGHLTLQRPRVQDAATFDVDTRLGGNRAQASGQARPAAVTAQLKLQAGKLAELNPLLALWGQGPVAGQAEGDGELQLQRTGKAANWQAGGSGRLAVTASSAAGVTVANARGRWTLPLPGADGDGSMALALEVNGLRHPRAEVKTMRLDLQGRRSAHTLQVQLGGRAHPTPEQDLNVGVTLQAQGGWDGQAWAGRISRLDMAPLRPNTPALLAASGVALKVGPGPRVVAEPGRAEVGGAFVRWQTLSWQGGERPEARAELQLEDLAVAPLLARWQPDFGWSGDLRVVGHASLLFNDRLTAELLLERQGGDLRVTDEFGTRALGLTDLRLALNVRDGVWQIAEGLAGQELGSFGGALTLRPSGLLPDAQTPIDGVLQANVAQLGSWGAWVPAGWRLGGRVAAQVRLAGRLGAPDLTGHAEGDGLALRHLLYGVDFTDGRFALDLNGQHAQLTQLEARGGGGWLRATGRAELGDKPSAHVEIQADKLRLMSRVDRRIVASGQAQLDLGEQGLQLNGTLRADEGLFDVTRADAPTLADDVTVVRGQRSAEPAVAAPPRTPRNTSVNVALDFGNDFKVRGRGLATTLRGQLQITQKNDGPLRVTGRLDANGGQYAAYGQKLDIERGDIRFTGTLDNPTLDLLAVRPNLDLRVGVRVSGTALAPRVALYSEPDMSDTDKLSWLLLGHEPSGQANDTALLQRAAVALLSGEGESATGRALRQLGLDELALSQSDGDTKSTIVRLGKQISRRWYVGYERGLNATTGSWQLIYRIAQRFTLRAQGGEDNALDLIWQWKWN
ncbi:translocation/assembly module TamB domain-containing protein [Roseateles cellulosilyticus]|uniref:Translocation/assembly module TamB domain-containing protein n=1 Tax=Pelomonas cellulosilytica TaxID=2906762 RepID=A0ABS8XV72_9BURK|nr:translocation/assembly module TamB domain-containing protein [Pelomonas sp. P8]MCE4554716.1 translocation/assembly module TamB domain-containing protein [Pelomonas sp. P8]